MPKDWPIGMCYVLKINILFHNKKKIKVSKSYFKIKIKKLVLNF